MKLFNKFEIRALPKTKDTLPKILNNYSLFTNTANATVLACKSMIIDSVSTLPVNLFFRKNDGERIKAYNHSLFYLLKYKPNFEEPSSMFLSRLFNDLLESGNAYIYKQFDDNYNIIALYLLSAKYMTVTRDTFTNQKIFTYNGNKYNSDQILHIPGKYYDGTIGKGLEVIARDAISLANRLDDYTRYYFENKLSGGRLTVDINDYVKDNRLEAEAVKEYIEEVSRYLNVNYSGEENAGKALITPPGAKIDTLEDGNNHDAQLLGLKELQEKIICKIFDIPWDIYNGDNKYNSLEQRNELFKARTLNFWTDRVETYLNLMLSSYEQERYYFQFNYNNFLKTDLKSRVETYIKQLQNGLLTINEIREKENLTSIDDEIGDVRFIPNTFIPLTQENVEAYLASSKMKLQEMDAEHTQGIGDDKL